MTDFEKVLQKAIAEPAFRDQLKKDPEAALTAAGVKSTPKKVAALKSADGALAAAHSAFGARRVDPCM